MTRAPWHPDLRRVAPYLPRRVIGPVQLPVLRWVDARQRRRTRPGVESVDLGHLSLRVHRPPRTERPAPGLLWIHGGGFVMGSAAQDDALCSQLCNDVGVVVAAVDHRFAPEHPFPVPLLDCYDAFRWLVDEPTVDPDRVAVGGASAGGGLAAAVALLARRRGGVEPAFQLLSYPMLDDRTAARVDVDDRGTRLWDQRSNRFAWRCYLGTEPGGTGVDELAAPARSMELTGLPPAWIGVGSLDLLLDEGLAHARRLRAAGVACQTEIVEGAFHGFDSVRPRAEVSRAFRAQQVRALRAGLRQSVG